MTLNPVDALGLTQDLGTVEVGKLADLVVLSKDPLADIRNTTSLKYVIKNGRVYGAAALDEVWPRRMPTRPMAAFTMWRIGR